MPYFTNRGITPLPSASVPPDTTFGANLFLWYQADNAGGALVEKTGLGAIGGGTLPLSALGTTAPTVDATGINGFPAYKFLNTGGGTGVLCTGSGTNTTVPALGTVGAVFAVVKITSSSIGGGRIFSMDGLPGDDSTNLFSWAGYISTAGTAYRAISNNISPTNTGTWTNGEIAVVTWTFGSGTITIYKNGSPASIDSLAPGAMNIGSSIPGTRFALGNDAATTLLPLDGWIGEIFVVNVMPSAPQLLAGYTWLQSRFGLP